MIHRFIGEAARSKRWRWRNVCLETNENGGSRGVAKYSSRTGTEHVRWGVVVLILFHHRGQPNLVTFYHLLWCLWRAHCNSSRHSFKLVILLLSKGNHDGDEEKQSRPACWLIDRPSLRRISTRSKTFVHPNRTTHPARCTHPHTWSGSYPCISRCLTVLATIRASYALTFEADIRPSCRCRINEAVSSWWL